MDVLGLNGDTLRVDRAKVGVFEQRHEVGLDGLLESTDGRRLESKVGLEILSDLANKALERELSNEKLGRLLVSSNLTKSDGTGLVAMGLLDTSGRGSRLAGSLGGKLLSRGLATSGLTGGLLGTSHFNGLER